MIRSLLLLAILVLAVAPTAAGAKMPRPVSFTVIQEPCPATDSDSPGGVSAGCAFADGRIYVHDGDPFTVLHEIGHVFAAQRFTEGDRKWFARMLGERRWDEFTSELFADVYALCDLRLKREDGDWPTGHVYEATKKRHKAICRGIVRAGSRHAELHESAREQRVVDPI